LELIPLEELGRPRIDVVVNCSGVFRDLFINQMNLLDQGVKMAAEANEPVEMNYVRKHARSQAKEMGLTVRQAATRIFSNASGYWVENGVIAYPVEEVTIAGNLKQMLQQIVAIGSDEIVRGTKKTGSILIESMTLAGN